VIIAYAESVHDRAAEWHVLGKRAAKAGTTTEQLAQRYVSVFKAAVVGQPRTKWLRAITADCGRPVGLPTSETWDVAQCQHVRLEAEQFLGGTLPDPCPNAMHWGMRTGIDHERALRARWKPATCAQKMANDFWRE